MPRKRTPRDKTGADDTTVGSRKSWLAPYARAWREAYDGVPPWGKLAKAFKELLTEHPEADVERNWRHYLGHTPGQFASPTRFAQTYGAWDPAKPNPDAWKHDELLPRPGESVDALIARLARRGY
jgi:hypothetical protein